MSVERIDIQIREDGSRVVKRNLDDIGDSSKKSADGVDLLKRALQGLLAVLAIDKIKQYADAWASASGQIAIATKNTQEATAVQDKLFKAAQNTRQGFTDVVDLYTRAARAGKDLGASQNDIIKFTEGVGKALAVQHTSSTQASGALLQLGQALGGAKIQAQEFNSLIDGAPVILQTVARGMDATGGSIGKLTQLVKSGQVTNKEFFDAFLKGSAQLDEDFAKSSFAIGQGLTVIENGFIKFIGELNESTKASQTFGKLARWIAENMDFLATALLAVGAAVAVAFAPGAIIAFTAAVGRLFALIYANPFIALAAGIAAAVVYLAKFGDEMSAGIDKTTSLNDVFRALGEIVTPVLDTITTAFQTLFNTVENRAKDTPLTFASVVKDVAHTFDAIGGLLTGLGIAIYRTFAGIPGIISNSFNEAYNKVAGFVQDSINVAIQGINTLRSAVGKDPIELINIKQKDFDPKAFEKYGADISKSFDDGFAQQGGALEESVDAVFSRAAEIGKKRLADAAKAGGAVNLDQKGTPTKFVDEAAVAKEQKALEKLQNQLRSLLDQIAPVAGAQLEMAKAQDILNKSVDKGLISKDQQTAYLALLTQHYKDIVDPLGKVNRELDEQVRLLNMSSQARAIETQMTAATQDLLKQGIQLDATQTAALRAKLQAIQDLTAVVTAQDQILGESVQKRKDFQTQTEAIAKLLADPTSGFTKGDGAIATANAAQNAGLDITGTQTAIDAQIAQFTNMYATIDQLRTANLISEQTATQMRMQVDAEASQVRLANAQQFFGNLAVLSKSGNSKIAAIGKAAAITQATIDGVLAVQKALASAPPPVNYALAAAVGVSAAANVAQIAGLGFMTGGEFKVGGTGGADSQMVAFRASPGEKVAVSTPTQVRKGDPNAKGGAGGGNGDSGGNLRIINLVDPAMLQDFLSTPDGERVLVNTLQRNAMAIKNIANS